MNKKSAITQYSWILAAMVCACAPVETSLQVPAPKTVARAVRSADASGSSGTATDNTRGLRQQVTPRPPEASGGFAGGNQAEAEPVLSGKAIDANIESLPIPAFINEVYGNLLGLNFQTDPGLARLKDLITLRVSSPQEPQQLYRLAKQVLLTYGVQVAWQDNRVLFAPVSKAGPNVPPLIISGRALPDVPISHRPVFQLVELRSVRNTDIATWLRTAFKTAGLDIQEDPNRNAIILQGKPDDVSQATAAIQVLDRPFMRGRFSTRLEPAFMGAEELAKRMVEVLGAEGYGASTQVGPGAAIIALPIPTANMVVVFAGDQRLLNHAVEWATSLDKPNPASGNTETVFYYAVQNTKAADIASTLGGVTGGAVASSGNNERVAAGASRLAPAATASSASSPAQSTALGGRLVVDGPRNGLLFRGDAAEWQRLLPLIRQMDKAAKQVLIEVTIAEVSLDSSENYGVAWKALDGHGRINGTWNFGTLSSTSGTGTGNNSGGSDSSGGVGLSYLLDIAGDYRANLTAFASDNRVSILSTPRLMVKSGEEASIDVGDDVPTISSQTTSSSSTTGGNSNLLQTIEYRKTGVILKIKPTIYSDDRIDLDISQEVSNVGDAIAGIDSPAFFSRSVNTSLSLHDGGSILLGGLISNKNTNVDSGVPLLKDIPILGNLFKSKTKRNQKTELVLLIVPYIVGSDEQARAVTRALTENLDTIKTSGEPAKTASSSDAN